MNYKDLYNQLFSFTLPDDKLSSLCSSITDLKLDNNNSFERYYNVNLILSAIEKYENHEISDHYFANWCMFYNWILMASSWEDKQIVCKNIQDEFRNIFIVEEISNLLDSLSFFEEGDKKYFNLKKYKNWFKYYDKYYQEANDLEIFSFDISIVQEDEIGTIYLAINHDQKEFSILKDFYDDDENTDIQTTKNALLSIKEKTTQLKQNNYKEIITSLK